MGQLLTVGWVNFRAASPGVSDNQVDIQNKVLLDWTQDIPGAYSITLVYTMETHTP